MAQDALLCGSSAGGILAQKLAVAVSWHIGWLLVHFSQWVGRWGVGGLVRFGGGGGGGELAPHIPHLGFSAQRR